MSVGSDSCYWIAFLRVRRIPQREDLASSPLKLYKRMTEGCKYQKRIGRIIHADGRSTSGRFGVSLGVPPPRRHQRDQKMRRHIHSVISMSDDGQVWLTRLTSQLGHMGAVSFLVKRWQYSSTPPTYWSAASPSPVLKTASKAMRLSYTFYDVGFELF